MPQEAEYDTRPSHSLQPSAQDQCGSVSTPQAASLALHAALGLSDTWLRQQGPQCNAWTGQRKHRNLWYGRGS